MYDNKTQVHNFPKPDLRNMQEEDVPRIAQAMDKIDTAIDNETKAREAADATLREDIDAALAVAVSGLRYKGTLDYGADTVASMESIPAPANGATCGVSATNLTYIYDEATFEWVAQPHGTDALGDLWRMASWYGWWRGQTFTGNATADIVCRDASDPNNPAWDLLVSESTPVDGVTIGSTNGKNGVLDESITNEKLATAYVATVSIDGVAI
jgi:hypothetical protein